MPLRRCSPTRRRGTSGGSCCASKISTRRARRPEFETAIDEDLAWLGLYWETPVRRQSEHFADYRAALDRAEGHADLLYPCFCTRKEIAAEIAASAGCASRTGWSDLSRHVPALDHGRARAAACARRCIMRGGWTSRRRHQCGGSLTFDESGDVAERRGGVIVARPAIFRRRGVGAQGYAGELSLGRRRRRCVAGRHAGDARATTYSRRRMCIACCRRC